MDRHICTAEDPYDPDKHGQTQHPDAKFLYTEEDWTYGLEYDHYKCPHCNKKFSVEIAQ